MIEENILNLEKSSCFCKLTGWEGFFSLCKELKPHPVWVLFTWRSETCDRTSCCFCPSTLGFCFFPLKKNYFWPQEKISPWKRDWKRDWVRGCVWERRREQQQGQGLCLSPTSPHFFISVTPGKEAWPCWPLLEWIGTIICTFSHISAISFFF